MNELDKVLDTLFAAYRGACPDPDISSGFMPRLWEKIDARRSFAFKLRLYARGLVGVTAALCIAVAVFQFTSVANGFDAVYTQTYVDALRNDSSPETLAYAGLVFAEDSPNAVFEVQ
jgi:hypothetical protein